MQRLKYRCVRFVNTLLCGGEDVRRLERRLDRDRTRLSRSLEKIQQEVQESLKKLDEVREFLTSRGAE